MKMGMGVSVSVASFLLAWGEFEWGPRRKRMLGPASSPEHVINKYSGVTSLRVEHVQLPVPRFSPDCTCTSGPILYAPYFSECFYVFFFRSECQAENRCGSLLD